MRVMVLSNLYPPVVRGGYEAECHDIAEHLRERHDVVVLTSDHLADSAPAQPHVLRRLPFADDTRAEVLRAPFKAVRGVKLMRAALAEVKPDVVYVWNAAGLPLAALHVVNTSGIPVAYRICEH